MSKANVDLVRSILAATERRDYGSAEWADPEIEYVFADGPTPGGWTGLAGMGGGWGDFLGAWHLAAKLPSSSRYSRARQDKWAGFRELVAPFPNGGIWTSTASSHRPHA
jgi:hypothetical protein